MARVLLCGAVSDYDNPFDWQEEVGGEYDDHDFVNPYQIGDDYDDAYDHADEIMNGVVDELSDVDGVLVRWEDDAFLVGAVVYMREMHRRGKPVVIWYDGVRDTMQIPLQWMMDSQHSDRDTAIRVLLGLCGDTSIVR